MSENGHRPARTRVRALDGGEVVEPHWHDQHHIVYAGRGVLSVTTDAGVWVTPADRALWVPARTVHQHRAYGRTDLLTVALPAGVNPLRLSRPAVLAVNPLLRELLLASADLPGDADPGVRRRLRAVLLDQLRAAPDQPLHLPAPRDPRLVAAAARFAACPAAPHSSTELAAAVGCSARTLARLCRAELGMTVPQWRTQLRLHHALQLLADDHPVTTVAARCGWATPSAFIDVFRRHFGSTPGQHLRRPSGSPRPDPAVRLPDGGRRGNVG